MKILFVIPSLGRGGAERVASLLSEVWSKEHQLTLAVFDGQRNSYPSGGVFIDLNCPAVAPVHRKLSVLGHRIKLLVALIKRENPDLIISFMESANFPTIFSCLLTGKLKYLIVSIRNNPFFFPTIYRIILPLFYRMPSKVVAPSEGIRKVLLEDFHLPSELCFFIPNPVHLQRVGENTQTDGQHIMNNDFVLACGRLVKQKGFDLLISAFKQCRFSDRIDLIILGEGPEELTLKALACDLGMADRVHFLGSVSNPYPYMSKAKCFILSSRYEGWPNVLVEAMACGCPSIAFDCPFGPSEIIEHQVNGLLVPPFAVDVLSDQISLVIENDCLWNKLREGGRMRANDFQVEKIASLWLRGVG